MCLLSMKKEKAGKEKGPSCQKPELGWLLRDELVQLCSGKSRRALQPFGSLGTWIVPLDGVQGSGGVSGLGFPFSAMGNQGLVPEQAEPGSGLDLWQSWESQNPALKQGRGMAAPL